MGAGTAVDTDAFARVRRLGNEANAAKWAQKLAPRNELMRRLRAAGKSYAEIAEEVGVSRQRVAQILTA